ncbi:hypothetical protein GOODEAATRI_034522 [Goodea atripinnis]|uniref:Secreted protein n=1 Tax=Goodea atripinnis TaxID=208336 RepID=A0ABV0NQM6_9TELE
MQLICRPHLVGQLLVQLLRYGIIQLSLEVPRRDPHSVHHLHKHEHDPRFTPRAAPLPQSKHCRVATRRTLSLVEQHFKFLLSSINYSSLQSRKKHNVNIVQTSFLHRTEST